MNFLLKLLKVLWALPNSMIGVFVGLLGCLFGGRFRFEDGCLEFWGGGVTWALNRLPVRPAAMTLGHVILGVSLADLKRTAKHERVHVRQYEAWGPLFIPAYLICSFWIWMKGGNSYLDNPFEVEAYREAP